jgi:hypothetical protein
MQQDKSFSIILEDMDVQEDRYVHRYSVLRESQSNEITNSSSPWQEVSQNYFRANEANLGMELASKDSTGKVMKVAAPPGYSNYVGNNRYGQWQNSSSGNFWVFYGQYAMMRSIFGMGHRPVYYGGYHDYRSSYYGSRPYYGSSNYGGKNTYGTNSPVTKKNKRFFYERKARNTSWNKNRSSRFGSNGRTSGRSSGFGFGK